MSLKLKAVCAFSLILSAALGVCGCSSATEELPVTIEAHTPSPTPSASPTPEPTPSPTPTPTPTPEPTPIPECGDSYYDAFFNQSVFVGDSITQGLQNYVVRARKETPTLLGDAKFAAVKSYSLSDASSLTVKSHAFRYQGEKMTLPEIVEAMQVKKVFIMLGVNDWAGSAITMCIGQYRTAIENIQSRTSEVEIYVQSCTPVAKDGEKAKLNNRNLDEFNASLKELCDEMGVNYIDISTPLKGEDNCMKREYSSDKYVHLSQEGAKAWVDTLYRYAYDRLASGEWVPEV